MPNVEEVARLRVSITGATEAQIQRLERLDRVLASLRRNATVRLNVGGLQQNVGGADNSLRSLTECIKAQANLLRAQNQLNAAQEQHNLLWNRLSGHVVSAFRRSLSSALDELKSMNKEMVSIQKVTEATDADMKRLKNSAFEVAGDLGSKPAEYLASVTKWAQAGYKDLSEQLGELSAKTQVVGDVNEETANKFLLAVDAAYKYKGNIDQLTRVLDGANEISNNYATSVEKLAGGMGIVSSLAAQAGMEVQETMAAIGTITAVTQESGNSAARALRALILNIQGSTEIEIDAETGERWTEDEIQRTAAALGELNVKTREYKDGVMALRNPMTVIGELAEKYQKGLATEAQIQEVVSSLGGKVRSNQLMALIQNYEMYTKMIGTYKDALGSADSELQIYLNGWEAKSNKLVAQWAQFIESFKATDISMGLLDVGNTLLGIANTDLGNTLIQIVTLTGAIIGLRTAAETLAATKFGGTFLAKLAPFTKIIPAIKDAEPGVAKLTASVKSFSGALYQAIGPIGIVIVGLTALAAIIDAINVSASEQAEKMADAQQEYASAQAAVEGLQSQLKTTQDRIDELNGKDSLTVAEQEDLDRLKEENDELERQLIIEKDLASLRKEALREETEKTLNKGYTGANYQPWRDEFAGLGPLTKEDVTSNLGRYNGFEQQAGYLGSLLDGLQEKKEKFLSEHGDESGWSVEEAKEYEKIKDAIDTTREVAISFRKELIQAVDNLPDGTKKDHWNEIATSLWEAMYPAEALTEKLERLVDAMDEAEQSRFSDALKRIQADGEVTAQEVQALLDKFPVLKQLLDANGGSLERLAQYLTEATARTQENTDAANENANANQNSQEAMAALAQTLKDCAAGAQTLSDAQSELKQNGTLSTNTLVALLGKYDDALDEMVLKAMAGLATQEEISDALQKTYEAEVDAYKKALLEKEMDNEDFYSAWLDSNAGTVKQLAAQYGVDAGNYKTFSELKQAIDKAEQTVHLTMWADSVSKWKGFFEQSANDFAAAQNRMLLKAQDTTSLIGKMYYGLSAGMSGLMGGIVGTVSGVMNDYQQKLAMEEQKDAMQSILDSINVNISKSTKSSKSTSGSTKSWYDQQIDALKKLEEAAKRTNQVLEQSDEDTSQKRVENLRGMQEKILAAQKDFIARGLAETSDEVNQLKIMYNGLGDDIREIWSSVSDKLLKEHEDLIWQFDIKANNKRTIEEIAADDAAMVDEYRKMQEEVHELANHYRSQGVRENDKLIRDLQDKWWEYEKSIRSMYVNANLKL